MKLDVVLPLYKPESGWAERLVEHLRALTAALPSHVIPSFILVNDGSPAGFVGTADIDAIRNVIPNFRYISRECNRGKGYTVREGVRAAQGDYVIYTDYDFPFGIGSVVRTLEGLESGADVVAANRDESYISTLNCVKRRGLTNAVRHFNATLLKLKGLDAQAGLKGFNRRGRAVFLQTAIDSFLFDTEFLTMAQQRGLDVRNVNVAIDEGVTMSKKSLRVLMRECWHMGLLLLRSCFGLRNLAWLPEERVILLTFDIEEFDVPAEHGISIDFESQLAISRQGTEALLDMLARHPNVRSTFYVTGRFAESAPDLVKRMATLGEIASHGYHHSEFEIADLARSKKVLETLSGQSVSGFRMPRMSAVSDADLASAGYRYDSSLNPTWIPGRYNALRQPANPHRKPSGLVEIPASVTPWFRFPLFWLSFKHLPLWLFRQSCTRTLRSRGFLNLYWHPWEFNADSRNPQHQIPAYILKNAGDAHIRKLERLIIALEKHGEFTTTRAFLDTLEKKHF